MSTSLPLFEVSETELGRRLGISLESLATATTNLNALAERSPDFDARLQLLLRVTEEPEFNDIDEVLGRAVLERLPIESLAELAEIDGIGLQRLTVLARRLATVDLGALLDPPEVVHTASFAMTARRSVASREAIAPYVRKTDGEVFDAGDWNALQVSIHRDVRDHAHDEDERGRPLGTAALRDAAVTGETLADESVTLAKLDEATQGQLEIDAHAAEIAALRETLSALERTQDELEQSYAGLRAKLEAL